MIILCALIAAWRNISHRSDMCFNFARITLLTLYAELYKHPFTLCVCGCARAHTHAHTRLCICEFMHVCPFYFVSAMYACVCSYSYVHGHTYVCVCIHVCMSGFIDECI